MRFNGPIQYSYTTIDRCMLSKSLLSSRPCDGMLEIIESQLLPSMYHLIESKC
eukprot:m.264998 g.264998  ORF g.264998 m.264998 type:complete len:53 (+) comp15624_c0_seq23:1722-1880(+)